MCLHLILAEKLDVCERVDLFFGLHVISAGKLDVCGSVDILFWFLLDFGEFCGVRNYKLLNLRSPRLQKG